jgi:serine/threonine protein kinase
VITQAGVILGTAAYMAPEQARGKPLDKRTDIWALGCLLFEMLSGSRPFAGELVPDVMAAVLKSEPDYTALPSTSSTRLRTVIQRCLQKTPRIAGATSATYASNWGCLTPPLPKRIAPVGR